MESYFRDYLETSLKYRSNCQEEVSRSAPDTERCLSSPETLTEHLGVQVRLSHLDPLERTVAGCIIGNLREDSAWPAP